MVTKSVGSESDRGIPGAFELPKVRQAEKQRVKLCEPSSQELE